MFLVAKYTQELLLKKFKSSFVSQISKYFLYHKKFQILPKTRKSSMLSNTTRFLLDRLSPTRKTLENPFQEPMYDVFVFNWNISNLAYSHIIIIFLIFSIFFLSFPTRT